MLLKLVLREHQQLYINHTTRVMQIGRWFGLIKKNFKKIQSIKCKVQSIDSITVSNEALRHNTGDKLLSSRKECRGWQQLRRLFLLPSDLGTNPRITRTETLPQREWRVEMSSTQQILARTIELMCFSFRGKLSGRGAWKCFLGEKKNTHTFTRQ